MAFLCPVQRPEEEDQSASCGLGLAMPPSRKALPEKARAFPGNLQEVSGVSARKTFVLYGVACWSMAEEWRPGFRRMLSGAVCWAHPLPARGLRCGFPCCAGQGRLSFASSEWLQHSLRAASPQCLPAVALWEPAGDGGSRRCQDS